MPDTFPNPLAQARAEAIARLRRDHAFAGAREGGIVLDAQNGALVEYVVGEEFSVVFDEGKLADLDEIFVLHTQPVDSPASQWDWQWMAEHANAREFITIGPTRTFVIQKPSFWMPKEFWRQSPFEDFESHMVNILVERRFSLEAPPDESQKNEMREEANRRMARQFEMLFWIEFL